MRKYSTAAIQSFHRFVQMLLFSMIQTIAPCAARRDDHEQRIGHADFHDLPLSVSLRSEALGYFRLSQGQTPIHTKRSSFVFFCLPRSSLFSPGLCALCASVVNPFCLLPSAFRPHRVPGVASVCTLYRKYGGRRRSCPALKTGKRFTCDEVM